jgi:hypothetical protein
MKKLIFSIAALAAIVVMGSCSQDSDLTNKTASSKTTDSVTVSLNLNSGIKVSESQSPLSRAAKTVATRAGSTGSDGNFIPDYSINGTTGAFTAYFVAANSGDGYTKGNIVAVKTGLNGSEAGAANTVTVPDIQYDIYVTNYPVTTEKVGDAFSTYYSTDLSITTGESLGGDNNTTAQSVLIPLPKDIYKNSPASQTLYLFGQTLGQQFSTAQNNTVTVHLYSPYAAVAVSKSNSNVNDVYYGDYSTDQTNISSALEYGSTEATSNSKGWFYEYILASDANKTYTINSTIKYGAESTFKYISFTQEITAGYVYQFTVNNSGSFNIQVNSFHNIYNDPIEIDPTK